MFRAIVLDSEVHRFVFAKTECLLLQNEHAGAAGEKIVKKKLSTS